MDQCPRCDGTGSVFLVADRDQKAHYFANTKEGYEAACAVAGIEPIPPDAPAPFVRDSDMTGTRRLVISLTAVDLDKEARIAFGTAAACAATARETQPRKKS
jgi:hypothetical protein